MPEPLGPGWEGEALYSFSPPALQHSASAYTDQAQQKPGAGEPQSVKISSRAQSRAEQVRGADKEKSEHIYMNLTMKCFNQDLVRGEPPGDI